MRHRYRFAVLVLLGILLCAVIGSRFIARLFAAANLSTASISSSDPDFSIVVFPDTQYYHGNTNYVFQDQANWVVANRSALNIKAVVGLGDMVDGGGLPINSSGSVVGSCNTAPPSNWQQQWQESLAAMKILTSNGIPFMPTIGNHDYDCEADRPQPRATSNYFHYFGPPNFQPTAYILNSVGQPTPNFYRLIKIGSTTYMFLSLELFPQNYVVNAVNKLISNFAGPVIVATHAYLSNDGALPTFGSSHTAGSAYPLCSGFPGSLYGCLPDSLASYKPVGGGTDGIALWYNLFALHPNILMTLSGHVRNPNPGNYPTVPLYNGVGYVNCSVQPWSTLCSNPYRPIQLLSDFQGQGNNGYFGYGYLRILTVSPKNKTVKVFTYSPSIANSPTNFPAGIPAYKTDPYDQYELAFPNTFGGPDVEITHITSPHDGSHVPLSFPISAVAQGPDTTNHMQIYVDGMKTADFPNTSKLPAGTKLSLTGPGVHRVAVQTYDVVKATWLKSVIYVSNPWSIRNVSIFEGFGNP